MASRGPISGPGGADTFYGSEPPSHTVGTGSDGGVLVPPFTWAMVVPGVYRSGYPMPLNYPFLERIGLRCIVSLEKVTADNEVWAKQQGIRIVELPCPENKEPFQSMEATVVAEALKFLCDEGCRCYKIHITPILTGKSKTGCVVACFRRIQGYALTATFDEYLQFAGSTANSDLDMQFIELFEYSQIVNQWRERAPHEWWERERGGLSCKGEQHIL